MRGHAMECDYHYLVMSDPEDVVKYSTRLDAFAALHKLLAKQTAAGFTTGGRDADGCAAVTPTGEPWNFGSTTRMATSSGPAAVLPPTKRRDLKLMGRYLVLPTNKECS
jgi:hypothetical protein